MRSHDAAGHSANVIPEQRDLVPVANSARHTEPPTLSPNAAMRGTGGRYRGRPLGRSARTGAVSAAPSMPAPSSSVEAQGCAAGILKPA